MRALAVILLLSSVSCTPRQTGLRAAAGGDVAEAVRSLKLAVRQDAKDHLARRELGLSYLRLGDAGLAEGYLDEASRLRPEDRSAWRYLALTREQLGWQNKAVESWEGLLQAHPRDRLAPAFRDHLARYKSGLSGLTPQAGEDRVETLREKGLLDDNNLPRAILVLPFEGPREYPEYQRLGRALARMLANDLARMDIVWVIGPDEALRGMRYRGLRRDPADLSGSMSRIGQAFGAGMVIGGILRKGFEEDVRADVWLIDPDPHAVLLDSKTVGNLGQFMTLEQEVLDKLLSAIGLLANERERASFGRFATTSPGALAHYSDGVGQLLEDQFGQALALQEKAVELDPEFPCPHRVLSLIYRLQGRIDSSRNALRKGEGRGNPRCMSDGALLARRIQLDAIVANLLDSELEQHRTIMRDGVHFLFVDESEPTARSLREGYTGSPTVTPESLPAGWIWGADHGGMPGTADPATRGGLPGSGLSAPDPATSGSGGAGSD